MIFRLHTAAADPEGEIRSVCLAVTRDGYILRTFSVKIFARTCRHGKVVKRYLALSAKRPGRFAVAAADCIFALDESGFGSGRRCIDGMAYALRLLAEHQKHQLAPVSIKPTIILDKLNFSHVESIVICILRLTAYNVIKRAVKGVADGYNIRKLNGIGYASKKFTQRSERDPRHPGELFVCYLFF